MLKERFNFPEPESLPFSDSRIEEDSQHFKEAKERLREEMKENAKKNNKTIKESDDKMLNFLTHGWLAKQAADADREKKREERRRQA